MWSLRLPIKVACTGNAGTRVARGEYFHSLIGSGVGAALMTHATAEAKRHGATTLRIESDPNAEAFYLRMGAKRVGEVPSGTEPGRLLPLLQLVL